MCSAVGMAPLAASARLAASPRRPMRAAFEAGCIPPCLCQHGFCHRHVARLALVGGAGERDLLVGKPELLGDAALDQRQCLKRLDGRAREDRPVHVAQRKHHPATGIHHRNAAAMAGFHQLAAGDLGKDGIAHGLPQSGWAGLLCRHSVEVKDSLASEPCTPCCLRQRSHPLKPGRYQPESP